MDTDDNKIKIGDGASTKTFSDDSVNAATYQPPDSDLTTIAAANNGQLLAATTASFTTADEKNQTVLKRVQRQIVASEVPFTPAGNLASTDVQAALQELDTEKAASSHTHVLADVTDVTATAAAEVNVLEIYPSHPYCYRTWLCRWCNFWLFRLSSTTRSLPLQTLTQTVLYSGMIVLLFAASTGLTISATSITVRSASSTQTGIVELSTDAELLLEQTLLERQHQQT